MAENGKGKASGVASATEKLGEADVLNLVLDYLATKGFVEAEQTLRQSVSASGGSPKKPKSNQQSGTIIALAGRHAGTQAGANSHLGSRARTASPLVSLAVRRRQLGCGPQVASCVQVEMSRYMNASVT